MNNRPRTNDRSIEKSLSTSKPRYEIRFHTGQVARAGTPVLSLPIQMEALVALPSSRTILDGSFFHFSFAVAGFFDF